MKGLFIVVALVAIAVAWIVSPATMKEPVCRDALIHVGQDNKNISIDPCTVFSESYEEAREKFRAAAFDKGAELHSLLIYRDEHHHMEYTTDIAVIKGTQPGVVVHSSGVHGVEGYAGSAIQVALLQHFEQDHHPTIVLVHAVNPYGMAWNRRTDQDNVDLNRNAMPNFDEEKMKANSDVYQPFEDWFGPARSPTLLDLVTIWFTIVQAIVQHGYVPMKRALITGQYAYPKGLFYGGTKLQPSHRLLNKFMDNLLLQVHDQDDEKQQQQPIITWIDVHTGLGKVQGQDTLLVLDSTHTEMLAKRVFHNASIQDAEVAAGYENIMGSVNSFYGRFGMGVTQEFGTINSLLVVRAFILENMAHHYGRTLQTKNVVWPTQLLRRAFYPHTAKFRKGVLQRGWTVLEQAMKRSE